MINIKDLNILIKKHMNKIKKNVHIIFTSMKTVKCVFSLKMQYHSISTKIEMTTNMEYYIHKH